MLPYMRVALFVGQYVFRLFAGQMAQCGEGGDGGYGASRGET